MKPVLKFVVVAAIGLAIVSLSSIQAAAPAGYAWPAPNHFLTPVIAFSSDGRYAAVAGASSDSCRGPACEGRLHIWDLRSGQRVFANTSKLARIMSVVFSSKGDRLYSGHYDGSVLTWNLTSFEVVQKFQCCAGTWIRALALSPDDRILAIGAQSGHIVVRPVDAGPPRELIGHFYGVSSLAFDATGIYLLSSADDQHVRRWNVRTGKMYEFSRSPEGRKAHRGMVKTVALLGNGRTAVSGSYWEGGTSRAYDSIAPPDHILRLWEVDSGKPLKSYPLAAGLRCCIQVLDEGQKIAFLKVQSWNEDAVLEVFDLASGAVERELAPTMGETFLAIGTHPDRHHFLVAIGDGQFLLWDRTSAKTVGELVSVDEGWAVLAPDGRMDYSEGFTRWPCRNNIQKACAGGASVTPTRGLLVRLLESSS